jgi:hypothetical protein
LIQITSPPLLFLAIERNVTQLEQNIKSTGKPFLSILSFRSLVFHIH